MAGPEAGRGGPVTGEAGFRPRRAREGKSQGKEASERGRAGQGI